MLKPHNWQDAQVLNWFFEKSIYNSYQILKWWELYFFGMLLYYLCRQNNPE